MRKKPAYVVSLASAMLLLQACATAPVACPSLPVPPAMVEPEHNSVGTMLNFLSGLLPSETKLPPSSAPAKAGSGR